MCIRSELLPVPGAAIRDERTFEARQRTRHVGKVDATAVLGKGAGEHRLIAAIASKPFTDLRFAPCHAHLDRMSAEYRGRRLRLKRCGCWIREVQRYEPGDVGQPGNIASPGLVGHSRMSAIAIGESVLLLVASGTGHRAVSREISIVE